MSELNDEIVNKGLAEVEYGNDCWLEDGNVEAIYGCAGYTIIKPYYTESLDSLIPIWERIKYLPQFKRRTGKKGWVCFGVQTQLEDIIGKGDTIQQAAAYATYKACVELGLIKE